MAQIQVWEKEYQDPILVTKNEKPQNDVLRFLKYLKKNKKINLENLNILDLGSGTGRNSNYLASFGNNVFGMEISVSAVKLAQERAKELKTKVKYLYTSMGEKFPFNDNFFDLILDVTSSNSLSEKERENCLNETRRVLKTGGNFFVRALCKDGDKNAKKLLKIFPGKEKDTYQMPEIELVERVFSESDFRDLYGKYFEIEKITKRFGYARFKGQNYKRNYLLAYLIKK